MIRTKSTTKEYFEHEYENGITFHREVVDGKTVSEYFTAPKGSHPFLRGAAERHFIYIPFVAEILATVTGARYEDYYEALAGKQAFINDVEGFDNFQDVIFCSLLVDGNIYVIDSPYPLEHWVYSNYIGGFTNEDFDLEALQANLKMFDWIRKAEIEEIPYYNRSKRRTHGLTLEFKIPQEIINYYYERTRNVKDYHHVNDILSHNIIYGEDPLSLRQFMKKKKKEVQ